MTQVSRVVVSVVGAGIGSISSDPTKLARDGSNAMTADLPAGDHKVVMVANPTNPQDAMNLRTSQAAISSAVSTLTQEINLKLDASKLGAGSATLSAGEAHVTGTFPASYKVLPTPTAAGDYPGIVTPANLSTTGFDLVSTSAFDNGTYNYIWIAL